MESVNSSMRRDSIEPYSIDTINVLRNDSYDQMQSSRMR
jgi:hypothetical protein